MHVVVVPNWALSVFIRLHVTMNDIASSFRLNGSSALFPMLSNPTRLTMIYAYPYLGDAFVGLYPHWFAVPKCNRCRSWTL